MNFFFLISIVSTLFICGCSPKDKKLPYLGNHTTKITSVNGKEVIDTVYHIIPDFELIDQDSSVFTQKNVEGKIYVVDFFFTSCPSICPIMTNQLLRVQKMTKDVKNFMIISHTVDPTRDTPNRMKDYAKKFHCDTKNWHFVYGQQDIVYDLGMNGYYLSMGVEPASPGGFIHSPTLVLVDQNRHIRGMYDGTNANEVEQLVNDINSLNTPQ